MGMVERHWLDHSRVSLKETATGFTQWWVPERLFKAPYQEYCPNHSLIALHQHVQYLSNVI